MNVEEMRFVDSYKNKRKVGYTAIIGNYDKLNEPKVVSEGFDYVCFTDDVKLKSKVWKIIVVDNPQRLDNTRLSRKIKILCNFFLKEYDLSIWIDGSISINCDLNIFLDENYHGEDIVVITNPRKSCIYESAKVLIALDRDDPEIINKQMEGYRSKGYPEGNGLIASGIMIRNHNSKKLDEFMNRWWEEICFKSKRDQLSFSFILWKYPLSVGYLDWWEIFASNFSHGLHENEKLLKKQNENKRKLLKKQNEKSILKRTKQKIDQVVLNNFSHSTVKKFSNYYQILTNPLSSCKRWFSS